MDREKSGEFSKTNMKKLIKSKKKHASGMKSPGYTQNPQLLKKKKKALLIVFMYQSCDLTDYDELPGALIDLYLSYQHAKRIGCDNIKIITDLKDDQKTDLLVRAMVDKIVDHHIIEFIDDMKKAKILNLYTGINRLNELVKNFVTKSDQLFVYFSGHALDGDMILPDSKVRYQKIPSYSEETGLTMLNTVKIEEDNIHHYSLYTFRQLLCDATNESCEHFIVLDCCQSDGMLLSFRFCVDNNIFKLSPSPERKYTKKNILCLSSSSHVENSISTRNGSVFSISLFGNCMSKIHTYPDLCENLEANLSMTQKSIIYTSNPQYTSVWNWMITKNDTQIEYNHLTDIMILNVVGKGTSETEDSQE